MAIHLPDTIDLDVIIEQLVEEELDIETVISDLELEDDIEVEDLIEELEKNDVFQCSNCSRFFNSEDFVKGLEYKVCFECEDEFLDFDNFD